MDARKAVRIGIVGLGYWGPNLVRNLADAPAFDVSYLCDVRAKPLETLARRYPGVSVHDALRGHAGGRHAGRRGNRHTRFHALLARHGRARGGQARLRREATRCVVRTGRAS